MATEFLKYTFSEDELRGFAKSMARECEIAAGVKEEKKAVMAQFAERIASSEAAIAQVSRFINNGYEHRMIECEVEMHTPEQGQKRVTRLDTGETVKVVAMSFDELQEALPFPGTLPDVAPVAEEKTDAVSEV